MSDVSEAPSWGELIPGGLIVYYADGDEEIIYANQYVLDLFECESFDELMELTDGSFRGFVHESDIDSAEDSIWGQVDEHKGLDHIYYQICTKSGKVLSVDDYGRLVRREGQRPVFYVFLVEMSRDSVIDWLTGLPGMDRFRYVADIEAKAIASRGEAPTVLVFDLMGMKAFNAANGRDEGDRLLRAFASILRARFGSDLCCRYAGDSFCTLTTRDAVDALAGEVFDEFAKSADGTTLPVMAGACVMGEDDDMSLVLDRAKLACESDRMTWESHLSWFTEKMRQEARLRAHVLEYLDRALDEGWVRPHYQGIVRSATGDICGEEALARWFDPVFGPLMPAQFVPALEEAGLLRKLDMHIVDCVLDELAGYIEQGVPVVPVSVNLSPRDLAYADIAEELTRRADALGISHELLRVEFTESAAFHNPDQIKEQVRALHDAGFEVWMDDFGSGFSSLNSLKEFDFDLIKLDMGFFTGGEPDRRAVIVEGVIRAAKRLGVKTLAEGIETREHAEELAAMGCDMLQGYRYFTPQPADDVMRSIKDGTCFAFEPMGESRYWDAVGSVSLADLARSGHARGAGASPVSELPACVVECRGGAWRLLRATRPLVELFRDKGALDVSDASPTALRVASVNLDEEFFAAVERCEASGAWERIGGAIEYGSGFQFSVKSLARCDAAEAYVVMSTPTTLGSALGAYGDVPVGYAVFRLVTDEERKEVVDAEYVYANRLYMSWSKLSEAPLIGRRLSEVAGIEGPFWLSLCQRAAFGGESIHDVVYSDRSGHWISYNMTPSLDENHCIFAFVLADAEQQEREELIQAGTHDPLTNLLNRRGIDEAVSLRRMQQPQDPLVLVLLDVDDFKTINDLYGHDMGDEALRLLAHELLDVFPSTAVVGRNGGDEALVALFGKDAYEVDRLLADLSQRELSCELRGHRCPLSLSAGFAWCRENEDIQAAYTKADEALYAVKLAGKSGYRGWDPSMEETPQRSLLGFTTRDLADGMPLAMLAHRPDGEVLFANEGFARLLGYGRLADVIGDGGLNIRDVVHHEDWGRLARASHDVAASCIPEVYELRIRLMSVGNIARNVVYRARLISSPEKGEVLYAYIVGEDVTYR